MRVWTDAWEWQCCGEPFGIGSIVEWGLTPLTSYEKAYLMDPLGSAIAEGITHCETHHADGDDEEPVATRGRIESIAAVYWRRVARPGDETRTMHTMAGTAVLEPRQTAGGGGEPESDGGPGFEGYIVDFASLG